MFDRAPAIGFPEHRSEPRVGAVEPVAHTCTAHTARRVPRGMTIVVLSLACSAPTLACSAAPSTPAGCAESSAPAAVKRICSTSGPTSAVRPRPPAASSNRARSRSPARSRGQRVAMRINAAGGGGRRGAAAQRTGAASVRNAATVAGSAGSVVSARPPHQSSNDAQHTCCREGAVAGTHDSREAG